MPWVKGQSGNPKGRPKKKRALSTMLLTLGSGKADGSDITRRRQLAETVWKMALGGDLAAAKLIYEYCDGKPTQRLEHTGDSGGPLEVQYIDGWRQDYTVTQPAPGAESNPVESGPVQVAGGGPQVAQDDPGDAGSG